MTKNPPRTGRRRRDATGHLDPRYAAELLAQSRENKTSDPPPAGFIHGASDDLAEELAEDFVRAATSAEDGDSDAGDELISEELDLPEGDDDDLAFEAEELRYPRTRPARTQPRDVRARKVQPSAASAKAKQAKASKAAQPRASKVKAKSAAKTKTAKTKTAKTKTAKTAKTTTAKSTQAKTTKKKTAKVKAVRAKGKTARRGTR